MGFYVTTLMFAGNLFIAIHIRMEMQLSGKQEKIIYRQRL